MARSKKEKSLTHAGKLRPIVQLTARMIKQDPTLLDDIDDPKEPLRRLRTELKRAIPELADPTRCANCGESMVELETRVNYFNVVLVEQMGKLIDQRMKKGMPFTEANKIRVNSEPTIAHVAKNCTTQTRFLGLIAKVTRKNGRGEQVHDQNQWSITARGFAALRGERVPSRVITFRNQIVQRFEDETTTFPEVIASYKAAKRREGSRDQSYLTDDYDPNEWVHKAGIHQGNLL